MGAKRGALFGLAAVAACWFLWGSSARGQGGGIGKIVVKDGVERVEGEYVVRFRPEVSMASSVSTADTSGLKVVRYIPSVGVFLCRIAGDESSSIRALEASNVVDVIEPNYVYRIQEAVIPNDPKFDGQWGLRNTGQSGGRAGADIRCPEAWGIRSDASPIVVAVIDTGVSLGHPDLKDNLWTNPDEIPGNGVDDDNNGYVDDVHGWDFVSQGAPDDDHRHGTHVSGTIGARGMNGTGLAGVALKASIMGCKFLDRFGQGALDGALEATAYAIRNGARVLNNSWGGGGESKLLKELIEEADRAGCVYVAAAGNDGTDNDFSPFYPASYDVPNVISVAALDRSENLADFSNRGAASVDLGAPGVDILSTLPERLGSYGTLSGTSMAAPHVSGAVAPPEGGPPTFFGPWALALAALVAWRLAARASRRSRTPEA